MGVSTLQMVWTKTRLECVKLVNMGGIIMRINKYSTRLDDNMTTILVKENSCNYSCVDNLNQPERIVSLMNDVFRASSQAEEYVWALALNVKCKLIGVFEISHGTVNMSVLQPREVFVRLCLCGASSFIIVHNHPSGDASPSEYDNNATIRLKEAGTMMGIEMLDHVVIGQNYYSYREETGLWKKQ